MERFTLFRYNYAKGAKELGVSERQARRYVKANKASKPVEKLIWITYRGYLHDTGPWAECSISYHNNVMTTPWGKVKPSDIQFVHRYKWSAKEHETMYKKLKSETKVQDQYLFDIQEQLLDIIGNIAKNTGS